MFETHYEIPRSQDDIIQLIESMEMRTKGKTFEETPYCWGARKAIEYLLGLEDYNPASNLGPVNLVHEIAIMRPIDPVQIWPLASFPYKSI